MNLHHAHWNVPEQTVELIPRLDLTVGQGRGGLKAQRPDLLAENPSIEQVDVLAAKGV